MDNQPPSVSTPIFPPPCPTRLDRMDVSHTQRRLGFNLQLLQGDGQLTTQQCLNTMGLPMISALI